MYERSIWIGYEPRELDAFVVAQHSLKRRISDPHIPVRGIVLSDLVQRGLYKRAWHRTSGRMIDHISDAPMSTEFAISRFIVPKLAACGWALYMDCDVLVRADLVKLFEQADRSKAVMCVKHAHTPSERVKMDGQAQVLYARKNWSSVMLFNCDHMANQRLTLEMINTLPGRDLHRFCWLNDDEIGELSPEWNYLVGYTQLDENVEPKIVHFTSGIPSMQGMKLSSQTDVQIGTEFAEEWNEMLLEWVR